MKIHIETHRLLIREIRETDEAGLFELDSNPNVHRYLGNEPVTNIEQIRAVIKMIKQQYADNGIGRWSIIDKETNAFIGWTGFKLVKEEYNGQINFYDLGYRLIEDYWGKGIATEAALACLDYAFNELGFNEIIGMCDVENLASRNVLEKSGMKFVETFDREGVEHNWLRITKRDWEEVSQQKVI